MSPDDMRKRAERYRAIAFGIGDARTIEVLHELAAEYEALAAAMEAGEAKPSGESP